MRRLVTTQTRDVLVRRRLRHRIQRERGDASTERDLIVRRTNAANVAIPAPCANVGCKSAIPAAYVTTNARVKVSRIPLMVDSVGANNFSASMSFNRSSASE